MKFKIAKVFDCQNMPENIKDAFFNTCDNQYGNDCYVDWYFDIGPRDDGKNIVSKWLLENGAILGDKVLINHWW